MMADERGSSGDVNDAGHYAAALPKAAQDRVQWQTAAEMLLRLRVKGP